MTAYLITSVRERDPELAEIMAEQERLQEVQRQCFAAVCEATEQAAKAVCNDTVRITNLVGVP